MSIIKRAVRVLEIPAAINTVDSRRLISELRGFAETERPRFVLDCSNVVKMDGAMIELLLSCLEEAMKLNGDVRLAALSPSAEHALVGAGVSRIFESFSSLDQAVQSFQRISSHALLGTTVRENRYRNERAA